MSGGESRKPINPAALALADAARLLAKVGGPSISESMLREDLAAGAPTNADGTINLVHYAAWLVRGMVTEKPSGTMDEDLRFPNWRYGATVSVPPALVNSADAARM